jgi:hypothetical protein
MNISAFLNPADEIVDNTKDEILDYVIDLYTERDRAQETDKKDVKIIQIR